MAPHHKFLFTNFLAFLALGFFLNLPSYSLLAEVSSPSEMRYLSRLIDQYGKHTVIDRILKLRNGQITVEIEGVFKDSTGRPQYSYITAKSLLKDIHSAGLSVAQFARVVLEAVREKQRQAKIETEKMHEAELRARARFNARAERERRRAARRRDFFEKYGDEGKKDGSSNTNTFRVSKNSTASSDPRWAVLKAGQIAAVSEEYLDEAYRYIADDDVQSLQVLLEAGDVFLIEQGVRVFVLDSKILRGRVKIRVEGTAIDLWTAIASIEKG